MFTRSIAMRRNGHSRRKALKHRSLRGELLEPRAMLSAGPLLPFGSLLGASATPMLTSASIAPSAGSTLSGVSEQLAAQGLDQSGHALSSSLRYAWSVSKLPSGAASPAFSVNSGSAAEDPTVTFKTAGTYGLTVVISDSSGHSATSSITITVKPVFTSVHLAAATGGAITGTNQQFSVQELDQFGNLLTPGAPTYKWSASILPAGAKAPSFSAAAASTTVIFAQAGTYGLTATVADGGKTVSGTLSASVVQTVTSVVVGPVSSPVSGTSLALSAQGLDQFGKAMTTAPRYTWSVSTLSPGATSPAFSVNGSAAAASMTATFKAAGTYGLAVAALDASGHTAGSMVAVTVKPVFTSVHLTAATSGAITATNQQCTVQELDQFGNPLAPGTPTYNWSASTLPAGAAAPSFSAAAATTTVTFAQAGNYGLTVAVADGGKTVSGTLSASVVQRLTGITVKAPQTALATGATCQCTALAVDQFQNPMAPQPAITWSATSGKINSSGLFTAPASGGAVTITAGSGSVSGTLSVTVNGGGGVIQLQDPLLNSLVNSLAATGSINRADMIKIFDTVAAEGATVSATDMSDLKTVLKDAVQLNMPGYVQVLAGDIVNGSLANANYQGQPLGDLAAGSSSTVLTDLVDKWFLGMDHPGTDGYGVYEVASGTLFANNTPSYNDVIQGSVGDCYLMSALGAIANSSPAAIRNMFIDNGDGTWTVRFYWNGAPDYVTVDNQLPVYYGDLFYAGRGEAYNNPKNVLWVPLAEKAYAQWNETLREGRNGVNDYYSLTAGWSGSVSAQVLGHASTDYFYYSDSSATMEQAVIDGLANDEAVTVTITTPDPINDLIGNHAYMAVGYSDGQFQLANPWGPTWNPGPLSWSVIAADSVGVSVCSTVGSLPISAVAGAGGTAAAAMQAMSGWYAASGSGNSPAQKTQSLSAAAVDMLYMQW